MQYTTDLKEKYTVDVFVAGGGAAGVAAAIAAARCGKTVLLAEATGALGGLGTSGMVPAFAPFDNGVDVLAAGIGFEVRQAVSKEVPLGTYWTPINTEELKREYDRLLLEAGVQLSLFTTVYDVQVTAGKVDAVILGSKSGLFAVKAKVYIDCTGDGDLCAFGGGRFEIGDENGEVMPQTLCSLWANVEGERNEEIPQNAFIEQAFRDGVLSVEDRHLPGVFHHPQSGIGGGNIGHTFGIDPLDETSLTKAMVQGRRMMPEYEAYYRTYMQGYEQMTLCATASILGVRESRRITCDYMLGIGDFARRAVFEDEIGRYSYPVDIHVMNTDADEYDRYEQEYASLRYQDGESYGIPYRSLIPVSFSNVLVAGRCIGTDRQMQASVRVMPGCFITGQAAGCAAALACATEDVRAVDIPALHRALKKLGAFLPNAQ